MAEETYNTNKGMNYSFTPTFIICGLMVNRKFAVHPIERNHYITLAISFFNDKAFKLHCKDYDK